MMRSASVNLLNDIHCLIQIIKRNQTGFGDNNEDYVAKSSSTKRIFANNNTKCMFMFYPNSTGRKKKSTYTNPDCHHVKFLEDKGEFHMIQIGCFVDNMVNNP